MFVFDRIAMVEGNHVIEQAVEAVVILAAFTQIKIFGIFGAERHEAVDIGQAGRPGPAAFMADPVEDMQDGGRHPFPARSEEHTSELQSLMRISYAVFCLKKKKKN